MTTATARKGKRSKSTRPAMTAEQARTFGTGSVTNSMIIAMAFPCGCQAYENVFTFGRWIAQGFAVRKGEKGTHISVVYTQEKAPRDMEEPTETSQRWGTAVVFCRHQVAVIPPRGGERVSKEVSVESFFAEHPEIALANADAIRDRDAVAAVVEMPAAAAGKGKSPATANRGSLLQRTFTPCAEHTDMVRVRAALGGTGTTARSLALDERFCHEAVSCVACRTATNGTAQAYAAYEAARPLPSYVGKGNTYSDGSYGRMVVNNCPGVPGGKHTETCCWDRQLARWVKGTEDWDRALYEAQQVAWAAVVACNARYDRLFKLVHAKYSSTFPPVTYRRLEARYNREHIRIGRAVGTL